MTEYSVQQLSAFAGVSVRTLHYYDQIGLLKPARRSEKGYRYYGKEEMLKLQQILFYRELDFPLKEIGKIINDPRFNLLEGLEFHKAELQKRAARYQALLATLEKTIVELKTKKKMMLEEEMYKGFTREEVKTMRCGSCRALGRGGAIGSRRAYPGFWEKKDGKTTSKRETRSTSCWQSCPRWVPGMNVFNRR